MGKPLTKRQIVFALLGVLAASGALYLQMADSKSSSITSVIMSPVQTAITLQKFIAVQEGMTYQEVVGVIGSPGTLQSEVSVSGHNAQVYSWMNPGGSNANVQFSNGKVVGKAQAFLR